MSPSKTPPDDSTTRGARAATCRPPRTRVRVGRRRTAGALAVLLAAMSITALAQRGVAPDAVGALGRLEPQHGLIRVAGPPRPAVVVSELRVATGEAVSAGDVIAILLGIEVQRAEADRLRAELEDARWKLQRDRELYARKTISESNLRATELAHDVAAAALRRADAELELSRVRAPIPGRVLEIHAREGERVGPDGIVEIGDTSVMYAVAEVYETDIGRVRIGQAARVRSPALPRPLTGRVEWVGLKIDKQDVLSTDPVADVDARVVEVKVRLDEPELAADLSNLRVEVVIETGDRGP